MPKYDFKCVSCEAIHTQYFAISEVPEKIRCSICREDAPQDLSSKNIGFDFKQEGPTGNTGVSKLDYPTADNVVGRDAQASWEYVLARHAVKNNLRRTSGRTGLRRKNTEGAIEYSSIDASVQKQREKAFDKWVGSEKIDRSSLKKEID